MPITPRHQGVQIPSMHETRVALLQTRDSNQAHGRRELVLDNVDQMFDALLAVVHGVEEGSAHSDRGGAQTEALQHISAAADTTVDEDFELREDGGAVELAFEEGDYRWWGAGKQLVDVLC